MNEPLRAGIIGYGLAGRVFHGSLLGACPGVEVAAVVTASAERRAAVDTEHPSARCFDSVDAMLLENDLDFVVVASPSGLHVTHAIACLEAGSAVVVDKPMAINGEEAELLVGRAGPGRLTVFQNRRWDSDHLTVMRALREDALGQVSRYEARIERWRPRLSPGAWREQEQPGAGVLLDLGAHLIDQALTLFGPVERVYAEVAARRGAADDDVFIALSHRSGVISHLRCGLVTAAPGPRVKVFGARAALVIEDPDRQEDALRAGNSPAGLTCTAQLFGDEGAVPFEAVAGAWDEFYPAVAIALSDGAPLPVDPQDAVSTARIIDAARRSSAGAEVVRLP